MYTLHSMGKINFYIGVKKILFMIFIFERAKNFGGEKLHVNWCQSVHAYTYFA